MPLPAPVPDDWLVALQRDAERQGPVLVGFSGGLDSTVLLHALASQPAVRARGLRAIHVDHGLHPQSPQWAQHCQNLCRHLHVALTVLPADITRHQLGPEGAARQARYAAFAATLQTGETLALAHHRDDQTETVLLRLLRGAGSAGLGGIPDQRRLGQGMLWRPLLAVSRASLRRYADAHALRWLDDPSNADSRFDRNFLRNEVLPLLRQRWPQADVALAHSARWLAEDAELLAIECDRQLDTVRGHVAGTLSLAAFEQLLPAWRSRVLRRWLAERALPPLPVHTLQSLVHDWQVARTDALPTLHWQGAVLHRWNGLLWAEPELPAWPDNVCLAWNGRQPITLPDGRCFVLDGVSDATPLALQVRGRRGGERIRLPGHQHHHALKAVLQNAAVPPWQRSRLPLLFAADGELLAAGEHIVSQRLHAHGWRFRPCQPADMLAN